MNDKNNNYKYKKIGSSILAFVIFAGTAIGAGFSFTNSISNSINNENYSSTYKNILKLEINVNGNTNEAASDAQKTLDFLGYVDSSVYTIGDKKIIIDTPISSYTDKKYETVLNNDGLVVKDYISEVETLVISLLTQGNIEFRTQDGQSLFDYNSQGKAEFVQPTFSSDSTSSSNKLKSSIINVPQLFSKASLAFNSGSPYISLIPKNDSINNELIKWQSWVTDTKNGSDQNKDTEIQYVAWFNYDELENFYSTYIDTTYDRSAGLYSVAFDDNKNIKPFFRPFLISYGVPNNFNIYQNEFKLAGTRSVRETKYFVNEINKSHSYSFDYRTLKTQLIVNQKSKIILLFASILFLLLIIFSMIFFIWYFGLLGSIGLVVILLTNLISLSLFSLVSLTISIMSIIILGIITLISSWLTFIALNIYKNEKDKSKSKNKKYVDALNKIISIIFVPLVIPTALLFIIGLVLPLSIAVIFYFLIVNIFIGFLITIFVTITLIFIFDLILNFTSQDWKTNWDFVIGRSKKNKIIKPFFTTNSKNAKIISIYTIIIGMVAFFAAITVSGIAIELSGSPINNMGFNSLNYSYNIYSENNLIKINDVSIAPMPTEEELYSNTENKINNVKKIFKENDVKIENIKVVRHEIYQFNTSNNLELLVNYGYLIETNKEISIDTINNINSTNLLGNNFNITGLSFVNNKSEKIHYFTNTKSFYQFIVAILIMILVSFILFTIFFKWGVGSSFIVVLVFEIIAILSPILFLFLPFNKFVLLPLISIIIMSIITKINIVKKTNNDFENENKWFNLANNQQILMLFGFASLIVIELLLMISNGFLILLPTLLITLISIVPIMISSNILFPYISIKFVMLRENDKSIKKNSDIRESKDPKIISEEMIEGINI